jgi:hypothetical protein
LSGVLAGSPFSGIIIAFDENDIGKWEENAGICAKGKLSQASSSRADLA